MRRDREGNPPRGEWAHHLPSRVREQGDLGRRGAAGLFDVGAKRALDVAVASVLLLLFAVPIALLVLLIRIDSPGPGFYRCRRVGFGGREFGMLKFRKMHRDAAGGALTAADDERFTRFGRFLANTKLDEVPQLWNVLKGEMSLVGPRPEDPSFVSTEQGAYREICTVRPGITGLSQLAFARESEILDQGDLERHYVVRIFPQKVRIDRLYAQERSLGMDLRIIAWTVAAVVFGRAVAVDRETGRLSVRRRPERRLEEAGVAQPARQPARIR
jgi:lipopolysaccharide/colanic/teichoic acid biosynthesis glycosyltransferase